MTDRLTPEQILQRILYRDALILVMDKPSGIPVHPANGSKHNLEQYFHLLQFGLPNPPTLGHRLDRATSGCLVLAQRLGDLFASNQIKKTYWAVVKGSFPQDEGRIDIPLSQQNQNRWQWWMKADPEGGVPAITDYRVLGRTHDATWLELMPQTGRTHQLRVHCAALGCPILGDYIYGSEGENCPKNQMQLHARAIEIPLYPKKPPVSVEATVPPHMENLLKAFKPRFQSHTCHELCNTPSTNHPEDIPHQHRV
jgi:tRNA pseudouridine32 synthase/23S rRNA pseudouridine746 synthase